MSKEIKGAEGIAEKVAKGVLRIVAALIGAIGAIVLLILNVVISGKHALLGSTVPQSHGVIGLVAFVVGALGAITTLFSPKWGAGLMAISGLGFIYVAGWGAILATPLLIIAAILAYLDRPKTAK